MIEIGFQEPAYWRLCKRRTITSYAQNFEDVMLWRALGHIESGIYVDVGAFDPVFDSVSLGFYELGWRGVHVEPNPLFAERLRQARPDETVHEAAVADGDGTLDMYLIGRTGMSSARKTWAEEASGKGWPVHKIAVQTYTLDTILWQSGPAVHWLKVDVEGFEETVLAGWREVRVLPWIVVVESVEPDGFSESHQLWERHLLDKGYVFVYFDGLNRFYISPEKPELAQAFRFGPSIWDDFQLPINSRRCRAIKDKMGAVATRIETEQACLRLYLSSNANP